MCMSITAFLREMKLKMQLFRKGFTKQTKSKRNFNYILQYLIKIFIKIKYEKERKKYIRSHPKSNLQISN